MNVYLVELFAGIIKYPDVFYLNAGNWGTIFRGVTGLEDLATLLDEEFVSKKTFISKTELLLALNRKYYADGDPDKVQYGDLLKGILDGLDTQLSLETLTQELLEYVRVKNIKESIVLLLKDTKKADDFKRDLVNILIKDSKLSRESEKMIVYTDINDRIKWWKKYWEERESLPTGIEKIDINTGGGIKRGGLNIVMSPTGGGKTASLIFFARTSVLLGKNVLFITLELSQEEIAIRFDMAFLQKTMKQLKKLKAKKNFKATFSDFLNQNQLGTLFITEFSANSKSVYDLKNYVDELEQKSMKNIDLVIIDYGDLIKATKKYEERRFALTEIFTELKHWASEKDMWLWTATQTNRQAMGREYVELVNISEAIGKAEVSDLVLGIQKYEDTKMVGISLVKNRYGITGVKFKFKHKLDNMLLLDLSAQEVEEEIENGSE